MNPPKSSAVSPRQHAAVRVLASGTSGPRRVCDTVGRLARQAYSRDYICEALDIPGEIETEQDLVRLAAIGLCGDPEREDIGEEWLQERYWIDFPDGYPPLPLPLDEGEPASFVVGESGQRPAPPQEKITDDSPGSRKSPTTPPGKSPTAPSGKSPPDYVPVSLSVVVVRGELDALLREMGQREWATAIRVGGLLCLTDYILRTHDVGGVRISAGLARDFVSEICHPRSATTIRKPLAVLEHIGLLKKLRAHIFGPEVKDSAIYVIPAEYLESKRRVEVLLNPNQVRKLADTPKRLENRLNRKWEWRKTLIEDLGRVTISHQGYKMASRLFKDGKKEAATRIILKFLDGAAKVTASTNPFGTVRTNLSSCPRELKPELLIGGAPVVICDISHAHYCLLPAIVMGRICHLRGRGARGRDLEVLEAELGRLREFLSEGDYYQKWCADPSCEAERKEKKTLLNMLLNWPNKKAHKNRLYRRMRAQFPQTLGILEDIKRNDHKNIVPSLHGNTAKVIEQALLELQRREIPAIPDTDALICPAEAKLVVCEAIGRAMHKLTGVCCKVGGIRYRPPDKR